MKPYLTVVMAARNDNYGGDFLRRMQACVATLLVHADRASFPLELIVVDWNPPPDRPGLAEAIRWPQLMASTVTARVIQVPRTIHETVPNADRIPLFEYLAKNAGIRRAEGEFVLCANPDIVMNGALIRYLAGRPLSSGCVYRIDRHDIDEEMPLDMDPDLRDEVCERLWSRTNTQWGTFPRTGGLRSWVTACYRRARSRLTSWGLHYRLHGNAAGDFCLLARDAWHRLDGYPELPTHSFIDTYMCFIAEAAGLKQVVLKAPYAIYHQEHDRSEHKRRPHTDTARFERDAHEMLRSRRPLRFNNAAWGLADHRLPEIPCLPAPATARA